MQVIESKKGDHQPFCVDRYEVPGGGVMPKVNVSWFAAESACKSQGKRLCELREWQRACGGKYPWGAKWDANKCNTEDGDELERSVAATGSFKGCSSRGVFDLVGNVGEWTAGQVVAGGDSRSGPDGATCFFTSKKSPGSASPYVGFRCCADASFE
jgi:formylglycine-generating enzyme required for sulfatase activity